MRALMRAGVVRAVVAGVVGSLALSASAQASSVRVPDDYFGLNFPLIYSLTNAERDAQLTKIKSLGVNTVRIDTSWRVIEPTAPVNGQSTYHWGAVDAVIAALAQHGIQAQVTLDNTPTWATGNNSIQEAVCNQFGGSSNRPAVWATQYFSNAFGAIARRYGRGGTFWSQNPSLPKDPVSTYEVWNEPNLEGGWCPTPEPALYADFFKAAYATIKQADPQADVIIGGMALTGPSQRAPNYLTIHDFLHGMLSQQPSIATKAAAMAVHAYPGPSSHSIKHTIATLRTEVHNGGLPDSVPLLVNEIGWATRGVGAVTEAVRSAQYTSMSTKIARSNCNVSGIVAHAWTSAQADPSFYDDWYGIANPVSGALYPTATAYRSAIALERGQLPAEAPHKLVKICGDMPSPDRDGDGVPDEHDYYPLDPTRWQGPPGWDRLPSTHAGAGSSCRRWYKPTRAWTSSTPAQRALILGACVARYRELRKAGKLQRIHSRARSTCRKSTPPASQLNGRHRVHRRQLAVTKCTYRQIRKAFALHLGSILNSSRSGPSHLG